MPLESSILFRKRKRIKENKRFKKIMTHRIIILKELINNFLDRLHLPRLSTEANIMY